MSSRNVGDEGFVWFFGVVEDVEDPKQLGRVRIRIPHEHSDEINTERKRKIKRTDEYRKEKM